MIVTDKERLIKPCDPVSDPDEGLEIARKLCEALIKAGNGVGLAAPQIGIHKQVFAIWPDKKGYIEYFVNPKIELREDPIIFRDEGCLSFPGEKVDTVRYNRIQFSGEKSPSRELAGFPAIVFQHEFDHLFGTLMHDRMVPDTYGPCFCGSGKKFKFCCKKKLRTF